jgi:hypothetical protein
MNRGGDSDSSILYDGKETSKFYGIGPRVGISAKHHLSAVKNLAVTASVSGGALYGKLDRDFSVSSDTALGGSYNDISGHEWVPFADAELGLAYHVKEAVFEAGYQFSYQDDAILLGSVCTDLTQGVKPSNTTCGDDKSSAETSGPFVRITLPL